MPFWLEAVRTEIPPEERQELKVLLWYVAGPKCDLRTEAVSTVMENKTYIYYHSKRSIIQLFSTNSKSFDTDMSPLPFTVDKMYNFITERFENTPGIVQEQNLQWLQVNTHHVK